MTVGRTQIRSKLDLYTFWKGNIMMTKLALFVRLEAKPGKEAALAEFLAGALPLANAEIGTVAWFALQFGPSTFGVFDAFATEDGRQAHLNGPIAAALMANAATLAQRGAQDREGRSAGCQAAGLIFLSRLDSATAA